MKPQQVWTLYKIYDCVAFQCGILQATANMILRHKFVAFQQWFSNLIYQLDLKCLSKYLLPFLRQRQFVEKRLEHRVFWSRAFVLRLLPLRFRRRRRQSTHQLQRLLRNFPRLLLDSRGSTVLPGNNRKWRQWRKWQRRGYRRRGFADVSSQTGSGSGQTWCFV